MTPCVPLFETSISHLVSKCGNKNEYGFFFDCIRFHSLKRGLTHAPADSIPQLGVAHCISAPFLSLWLRDVPVTALSVNRNSAMSCVSQNLRDAMMSKKTALRKHLKPSGLLALVASFSTLNTNSVVSIGACFGFAFGILVHLTTAGWFIGILIPSASVNTTIEYRAIGGTDGPLNATMSNQLASVITDASPSSGAGGSVDIAKS